MAQDLQERTKQFALRVIRLVESLPDTHVARRIGDQLLRAGMSVGANYRAACRGRSPAEFRAKLGIVVEEGDETIYWMELLVEGGFIIEARIRDLMSEAHEIVAMTVASIKTSTRKSDPAKSNRSGNP